MKNKVSDVRTQRSRQLLADALIELMKEKPVAKITVNDIVKQAKVARTTFYAQFEDKNQFVEAVIDDKLHELRSIVMPRFDDEKYQLTDEQMAEWSENYYIAYFKAFLANADFFRVMLSENGIPGFVDKLVENGIEAYTYVFQHAETKEFPLPAKYIVQYLVSAHIGLGIHWLQNDFKESPEYMARIQERLTYKGLLRGLKLNQDVTLLR
ncbi:MAG: TetR/AcrR family transcriptional regulator [Firmicutes bacterium]|nr:TetR/AcrR family transcriptional regulator [Bacillota bacterium]